MNSKKNSTKIQEQEEQLQTSPSSVQKNKALRSCEDLMLDIQGVKENALSEGDYKTALKAIELEGKQLALFNQQCESIEKNTISEEQNAEEVSSAIKDFITSLDRDE